MVFIADLRVVFAWRAGITSGVDGVCELGDVLIGGGLTLFGAPPLALLPYPVLVRGGHCRFLDVLLPVHQQLAQVPVVGEHVLRLPAHGVERDLRALEGLALALRGGGQGVEARTEVDNLAQLARLLGICSLEGVGKAVGGVVEVNLEAGLGVEGVLEVANGPEAYTNSLVKLRDGGLRKSAALICHGHVCMSGYAVMQWLLVPQWVAVCAAGKYAY